MTTRLLSVALLAALAAGQAEAQVATQPAPTADPLGATGSSGSLIIDQQRADRAPVQPATPSPNLVAPGRSQAAAPAPAAAAARTPITAITVTGSSLPPAVLQAAWAPFVGQPLTQAQLQAVADAVTRTYAASDIALYTVRIPTQTFAGGAVQVVVSEGLIGQVAITGDVRSSRLRLLKRYAAKLTDERPLHRRTLERYLSLIRDIPGLTVEPKLQASKLPGVSVLILDIKRRRFRPEFDVHDRGTPRLGRVQAQAALTINGLIQQGDVTRISLAAPTDWDSFQYVSLAHALPLGSEGLTLTASMGYLRTRPKDSPIQGSATTAGLSLAYPVIRGFRQNLYVTASLDGQDSDNAVLGQTFSSDHTRAGRLGVTWSRTDARRSLQAAATLSQGLDILGAEADSRLTDGNFHKLDLHLAVDQQLGKTFVARVRGTAQLTDDRLPSAEQLALGGEPYGRAFPTATLVGDSGAAATGELAWISPTLWPTALQGSELYGFTDWGRTTTRARLGGLIPHDSRDLASAGVGVRLNWRRKIVFNLEGATSVENPYPQNDAWRLLFGWRSLF